ncbi:hypothetical protein V8V91_12855 [Algoriphagus halophilus]|uniref:hypothetical protein n=1 Tax=Algoriphagus halophilus TaxID=226505 RepID=UPI00358E63AB
MRNFLLILAGALISLSCQPQESPGEPPIWSHFIRLETADGEDYFSVKGNYKISELKLCTNLSEPFCTLVTSDTLYYTEKDGFKVIGVGRKGDRYLDFGNGDIDTLSYQWSPNVDPSSNFNNLDYFDVFYNGKKVFRYDFKNDTPSWQDLMLRNGNRFKENLIIIPIVKEDFNEGAD